MKLYYSPTSPYVRKVMVLLHETGQIDDVTLVAGCHHRAAALDDLRDTNAAGLTGAWTHDPQLTPLPAPPQRLAGPDGRTKGHPGPAGWLDTKPRCRGG